MSTTKSNVQINPDLSAACARNEKMNYAYVWHSPDYDIATANGLTSAPASPVADDSAVTGGIIYLNPEGERKKLSPDDIIELWPPTVMGAIERDRLAHERRIKYLRRRLQALPAFIRYRFSRQLEELTDQDPSRAVKWLFGTFERHILRRIEEVNAQYLPQDSIPAILLPLREDFHLLPWANKKRLKRLAYKLANLMKSEFMREFDFRYEKTADVEFSTIYAYGAIASKASSLNIAIPGWKQYCDEVLTAEDALRVIARLQKEKWWLGKLRKIHDRWREHLLIATSYVSKVASPYCSEPCLREWVAQKKANFEYLQAMELEDQDTGERTSLLDKVMGSVSNPKIARHELMVRMRGFEDMANETGLVGMFYTLTAPSRYHATHVHSGKRNDKYCNASPRKTQKYLCNVWSRVRAKWGREGIRTFGFRVAEPHHDGTPHWHLLLFLRPEEVELATEIFHEYALQVDGCEPGAAQYRFTAKPIDEEFGSATGYIAKYISKNIDGYGMDGEFDHESGKPVKEMAKRVRAWASRWSIRQFQQIGGAPVSTWRELRRLGSRELVLHPELEAARAAADAPDWSGYVNAQGGPFVTRDCLRVRLNYEYTENGNDYGDTVAKISGVYCPFTISESVIYTRTNDYKIVPKRKPSLVENLTLEGRDAAPWSSVNNCTGRAESDEKPPRETAMSTFKCSPHDSSVTELPLNIEDLKRYSRQQRQEIIGRLRKSARENSDQIFMRTARGMRTSIDDETALAWGPKVTAAKDLSLTPEEAEQRWREQLQLEAKRRADNYAAAASEYQKKKSEVELLQQNGTASNGEGRNSLQQGISGIWQTLPDHVNYELHRRNIALCDGEVKLLVSGCILARGEMEFAIREGELIVERRLFKHANHAPASLTKQSELLNRCQKASREKL